MMFPKNAHSKQWTLAEIDQLDVHFFYELMELEESNNDNYLSDVW